MKFTLMTVFGLVVLGAVFGATSQGSLILSLRCHWVSQYIMILGTEMDIADISKGAGDGVVGDIGVERGGRGRRWAWQSLKLAGPGLDWIPFYGRG